MDERIKLLLKKTRRFQFLAVVLAVACLLVFLVLNFSWNEHNGAFDGDSNVDKEVTIPLDRETLENLEIEANDVALEVGMVSNLTEPQVRLDGQGYTDQVAKVDIDGTDCSIVLKGETASPEKLTMQVLLPQCDLKSVVINGSNVDLHVERLRSNFLGAALEGGYGYIADVKANGMEVIAMDNPIRLANNRASSVKVDSSMGSVTFMENAFEQVTAGNDEGGIFVYEQRAKGQWYLQSQTGDITVLSKNLPYNLLVEAKAEGNGKVDMGYSSRFWKKADIVRASGSQYYGSVGNNPNKIIQCYTIDGNVMVGQRERYSNLDPYAGDYPYAKENPYSVERSTKTK